jgi:hypothetical protein
MDNQKHEEMWPPIKTFATYILAWLGSWGLAEVQQLAGIISACIIAGFGATQWYVLWRDKIRKQPAPKE